MLTPSAGRRELLVRTLSFLVVALCLCGTLLADPVMQVWDFPNGDVQGWQGVAQFTQITVANGTWRGQTTGNSPYLTQINSLNVPASLKHYIRLRLRCRRTSGNPDRYPYSEARLQFTTSLSTVFSVDKALTFTTFGHGHW